MNNLEELKNEFLVFKTKKLVNEDNITKLNFNIKDLEVKIDLNTKSLEILNESQYKITSLHSKLENLLSYGLTVVLNKPVKIFFKKQDKSGGYLTFRMISDGRETNVFNSRGGGIEELISFLMRFIVVVSETKLRKLIILDEQFSAISEGLIERLIFFIKELAEKSSIQFIMVTHNKRLRDLGDVTYIAKLGEDGYTKFIKN